MITVIDTVAECGTITALQMPAIKFLEFLYIENTVFAAISFQFSSYTLFTQCYTHIAISINRYWTVLNTTKKGNPKFEKSGKIAIWFLPFLTIPFIVPRFWFNANFIRDENGRLWPSYNTSKDVEHVYAQFHQS
uniref:Serpentine receptor class gamma n=1 Tax=Panagrolaimus sp. PS1159 TaxID=55785 RepID=A0AC35GP71_9BILA